MFFYAYRDYVLSNLYNKVNSLGHDLNSDEFTDNLLKAISTELNDENSKNSMLKKIFIKIISLHEILPLRARQRLVE